MEAMLTGIINLKKEAGMTSHDAVFRLRKLLKEKKIGHGGTLDPDVTGVLPIAVGKATRLIEYMQEEGKIYEGEVTLGYSTTTEDASGEVVEETPIAPGNMTEDMIDRAMQEFVGTIEQVPPMYSAVKVKGRKLYEYARAGESVDRPVRRVTIRSYERTSPVVESHGLVRFRFRVVCGKGTYVRTLAVDLGKKLGVAAHMSQLERTASSGLFLSDASTLSEIEEQIQRGSWDFLLPMEEGIGELPIRELTDHEWEEIRVGRFIPLGTESPSEECAAFYQKKVVAILVRRGDQYKPQKVLRTEI